VAGFFAGRIGKAIDREAFNLIPASRLSEEEWRLGVPFS
jgi:hypothetical protein